MCISLVKVRLHINRPSISKLYGYVVEIAKPLIRIGSEEEERCTHTYSKKAIERSCGEDRRENGLWEIPSFSPLGSPYLFKYHLFTARYLRYCCYCVYWDVRKHGILTYIVVVHLPHIHGLHYLPSSHSVIWCKKQLPCFSEKARKRKYVQTWY